MRRIDLAAAFVLGACILVTLSGCDEQKATFQESDPAYLSSWTLMTSDGRSLLLSAGVVPYQLNSTLFTDYAHKLRTVSLPKNSKAAVNEDGSINFPVGTIISKTFFYPREGDVLVKREDKGAFLEPSIGSHGGLDLGKIKLIETRLLVHRASGWVALPYVWNEAQTEAKLEITGDAIPLSMIDGTRLDRFTYIIPDKNQCAGCHATNATTRDIKPIGPRIHNLNRPRDNVGDVTADDSAAGMNQLTFWQREQMIDLEVSPELLPALANWSDKQLDVESRARAYLDVNCGHCHNEQGAADTSGLFLNYGINNPVRLGRCKLPIAAGQGTGGNKYSIVPGQPDASILVYRMQSLDPGAMMPELGRSLVHREGVEIISNWIASMDGACE